MGAEYDTVYFSGRVEPGKEEEFLKTIEKATGSECEDPDFGDGDVSFSASYLYRLDDFESAIASYLKEAGSAELFTVDAYAARGEVEYGMISREGLEFVDVDSYVSKVRGDRALQLRAEATEQAAPAGA